MKRKVCAWLGVILLGAAVALPGCGDAILPLTADQQQQVGEYAAVMMLKYDAKHRSRLVDLSQYPEVQETEEPLAPPAPEPEEEQPKEEPSSSVTDVVDVSGDPVSSVSSIEEFLGLPAGISLVYSGYEISEVYQDNEFFSMTATEGKTYVILRFLMNNSGSDDTYVDFLNQNTSFRISINGGTSRTTVLSPLQNNLATWFGNVGAGASEEVVLLFELEKESTESVNSIVLSLKNASDVYTISLL